MWERRKFGFERLVFKKDFDQCTFILFGVIHLLFSIIDELSILNKSTRKLPLFWRVTQSGAGSIQVIFTRINN